MKSLRYIFELERADGASGVQFYFAGVTDGKHYVTINRSEAFALEPDRPIEQPRGRERYDVKARMFAACLTQRRDTFGERYKAIPL